MTSQLTSNRLTCREAVELITDYLEAMLLPEMEARFKQHLATCSDCAIYVEQIRQTLHILRQLTLEITSKEAPLELLRFFRNWQKHHVGRPAVEVKNNEAHIG